MQVAKDHGFTEIADVDIMDAEGKTTLLVADGKNITENFVGSYFNNYDSFVVLSHFKGHAMAGFSGAIKNISIGIASAGGKSWIHTAGTSKESPWGGAQNPFLESMAEDIQTFGYPATLIDGCEINSSCAAFEKLPCFLIKTRY